MNNNINNSGMFCQIYEKRENDRRFVPIDCGTGNRTNTASFSASVKTATAYISKAAATALGLVEMGVNRPKTSYRITERTRGTIYEVTI